MDLREREILDPEDGKLPLRFAAPVVLASKHLSFSISPCVRAITKEMPGARIELGKKTKKSHLFIKGFNLLARATIPSCLFMSFLRGRER